MTEQCCSGTSQCSSLTQHDFPFPLQPQIVKESLFVHEIFKTVQIELNQAKIENETLTVFPNVFGLLFDDIIGKYIGEEYNPTIKEEKIKHISRILAVYIKGIMPWPKFVQYTSE